MSTGIIGELEEINEHLRDIASSLNWTVWFLFLIFFTLVLGLR